MSAPDTSKPDEALLDYMDLVIIRSSVTNPTKQQALEILLKLRSTALLAMVDSISTTHTNRHRLLMEFADSSTDLANAAESRKQDPIEMLRQLNTLANTAKKKLKSITN